MKLSIWQQFSSNHSNSFTVVGKFETESDAHLAYVQIRRVLRRIINAHKENPPEHKSTLESDVYASKYPSQAEIEILAPYGVTPKRLTDWTTYYIDSDDTVHNAVRLFDKYVIFCDPVTGWSGADTFVQLMFTFTDDIVFNEEINREDVLVIDIHCIAPDEEIAGIIYGALRNQQQNPTNQSYWGTQKPIAWLMYHDGTYNPEYKKWVTVEKKYLAHERWRKKQWEMEKRLKEIPKRERSALQQKIDLHILQEPHGISDEENSKIVRMRWRLKFADTTGNVAIDDCVVECKGLKFGLKTMNYGVPAIVSWMREQGCTVDYKFRLTQFRTQATVTCRAVDEITANRIVEQITEKQTEAGILPDNNDYFLTSRDTVTSSFDEITIQFYDYRNQFSFEHFLKSLGCRRLHRKFTFIEKENT